MVKTAVLCSVLNHTKIQSAVEENHFRNLYMEREGPKYHGSREGTMSLLLSVFDMHRRHAEANADSAMPSEHERVLAEIIRDVDAGPFLRATLNALKYAKYMGGFERLRDLLGACSELYHFTGDTSFREAYLQSPMLQGICMSLSEENTPLTLAVKSGFRMHTDSAALGAYHNTWKHMLYVSLSRRMSRTELIEDIMQYHRVGLQKREYLAFPYRLHSRMADYDGKCHCDH